MTIRPGTTQLRARERLGRGRGVFVGLALLVAVVVGACGTGTTPADSGASAGTLRVVTTTTILADLVAQVGGAYVQVESIVPKGGEVHTFDPRPSNMRRLAQADVVFLNGLGLDDWLATLVTDSGTTARVVSLGENLPGVTYLAGTTKAGAAMNPHLWLDVSYAAKYVERIGETLAAADPVHATAYRDQAAASGRTLADLDAEVRTRMATIPAANRTVISFHDAFPYFAAAYGLTIDGTIVDAPGQDPSAAQVAALIGVVREKGVKAIFAEAQFNEALAQTIANETGARVVSSLYTDSTGDAPKDTYVGMMRWNLDQVLQVLGAP
jgi:manganese/iron transport system substrate-binding protein